MGMEEIMAKGNNQKLKLVYLIKILLELTDDDHSITMPQIIEELAKYEISAERKSIYSDIEEIGKLGIEIIGEQRGKNYYYHVGKKQFELAEIKLLVDAIQSSKFITEKKSSELIKKLESNVSRYEAGQLNRQVIVDRRIKNMNESIYYNVDSIHYAIANDRKISFLYYQWNVKKELELRKNGERYEISPWSLTWDNENYYLIAFDSESKKMKHYRVDKMKGILALDEKRDGKEVFDEIDLATYTKTRFGMYAGDEVYVKIRFKNELIGVVIDRFGKDIFIKPDGDKHFIACIEVDVSQQFLGWIFGLGNGAKIISPENVVEKMNNALKDMLSAYH